MPETVRVWGGAPAKCPRCAEKVYAAEESICNGEKWHKMCLKCMSCNKMVTPGKIRNHEDQIFCESCHVRLFGPKGYGFTGMHMENGQRTSVSSISPPCQEKAVPLKQTNRPVSGPVMKFGAAPKCPRCTQSVYAAEKVIGGGRSYHKACFKCKSCDRKLDSMNICEKDDALYCKSCYGKLFGPKGFGFGIATMNTQE